jgi:hypothetical protein
LCSTQWYLLKFFTHWSTKIHNRKNMNHGIYFILHYRFACHTAVNHLADS